MVIVESHVSGSRRIWSFPGCDSVQELVNNLQNREGNVQDMILRQNRQVLLYGSELDPHALIVVTLSLNGGKGGFGSMLRAIGAQIEKTTNREACRDLSGRRLRDINEEKRLKDFISKKADKEREVSEKKKKKFEQLNTRPKHIFEDETYFEQREKRERSLHDAIDNVFASSSKSKRPSDSTSHSNAKKKTKFMDDLDDESDASNSEDDGEHEKECLIVTCPVSVSSSTKTTIDAT